MYNPFTLEGKTIMVTGASSGIGKHIAIDCSKMGARLAITGRNEERLRQTMDALEGDGHKMIIADLNKQEDIDALVSQTDAVDGLALIAGIGFKLPVKFINQAKIDEIFKTNLFAPMLIVQGLLKKKKINKGGSILLMSSAAAFYATVSYALYGSSKGALNSFMKVLALEVAPLRVRVNSIQPAYIQGTAITEANVMPEAFENWSDTCPLGRCGNPQDVSNAAIYFLSDASTWITGNAFIIDGGITLR